MTPCLRRIALRAALPAGSALGAVPATTIVFTHAPQAVCDA
ncbi:hypothetical protein BSIN_1385 [Burkholderia singularis]|uniref:Uncharacterized protein n=1 Tax=Burkholderia singularis TaxID=1503053 RepID=A0A238GYL6_9BURK|nr:hypothetical protein BSIN_1385 [Burkholderia singularis]